jgi:hypothetical protein
VNTAQAKTVIAALSAAFPREPMPPSSVQVWASELEPVALVDAQAAVQLAAVTLDRMPSLHQLLGLADDMRRVRVVQDSEGFGLPAPSGPYMTFRQFLKANPDMAARVKAIGGPVAEPLAELGKDA